MAGGGYLVIAFCFGLAGGVVARLKGNSVPIWFLISAVVPFIGLVAAVCQRSDLAEERRACTGCGAIVPLHDALCTHCGTELEYPQNDAEILPSALAVRG